MARPDLRHFDNRGIYNIFSDPVEALVGEAWVPAVYTDKGWATADGASLLSDVSEWRDAPKTRQESGSDLPKHQPGDEGGQTAKASSGNRTGKSRKKPEAQAKG